MLFNSTVIYSQTVVNKDSVQSTLEMLRIQQDIPGINFSIIDQTGNIYDFAVGYADVENKIKNTTNARLLSGSIGKTYAATIIFQMVDEGLITLEDKILDYFPDIPWMNRIPNIQEITIEMLLQHRSGLPRWVLKMEVWKALHENPDKVWTYKDRLAFIFDEAPIHPAGKGFAYSDTNYLLLGMLIEKLLAKDYYRIVEERLLVPHELKNTVPSNERAIPGMICGYSRLPEQFFIPSKTIKDGQYAFNPQVEWTGGGMASTAHDLAKWCKLYFEGKLFSPQILEKVTTIHPYGEKVLQGHSYGMGAFIYDTPWGKAYGHSGFMPGYNALMIYFPEKKLAMAIQINADYASRNLSLNGYVEVVCGVVWGENE